MRRHQSQPKLVGVEGRAPRCLAEGWRRNKPKVGPHLWTLPLAQPKPLKCDGHSRRRRERRRPMRRLACAVVDLAPEFVAGVKTAAVLTGLGLRVVMSSSDPPTRPG